MTPEKKIVWEWQSKPLAPYSGRVEIHGFQRLKNNVTMIAETGNKRIIEVDKAGKIVRSIGGAASDIKMGWTSGFTALPDGNLLINDYTGRRVIEVDGKGKVVNEWRTGSRTIASVDLVR